MTDTVEQPSTPFRSAAEKFVTEFLDYMYDPDILDQLDKKTNKMVRSPGVEKLYQKASRVFPKRVDDGKAETDKLTQDEQDAAIAASPGVVLDTREMFGRSTQKNGGVRELLRQVMQGDEAAMARAADFFAAEDGQKEFAKE